MAYTKQFFEDGQVLTAAQLNHIEDGLMRATTLTVTIDEEGMASHTASEIYAHVQSGGTAVLFRSGDLYNMNFVSETSICFYCVGSDNYVYMHWINEDGSSGESDFPLLNEDAVNGLIDEKLAAIPIAEEATF